MKNNKPNHIFKRFILLCSGLIIMAIGVAFSIKAGLGTSPISSVPYVTAKISGLSVGITTIIMNALFIIIQICILNKEYDWFQLLQFPAAILFGSTIDIAALFIDFISISSYWQQWILCILGIIFLALGISFEIQANLVTTAGEGVVLAICKVFPIKFGNMKVIFDITLVTLSVLLSIIFLGELTGVREGTIAAAILVGLITKKTNILTQKLFSIEKH
ncbi:YczE/YyaS/YitT family protein [Faecalitalea cylindroides]|uniref:YczE/YyaS/YitT family protein n=1 Tax=Faecalitalea cylindroides TaxID=39483 RepID=UPI0022E380B8|nr:DUF6198 family protein [Faecalitalea cylindroides]